MFGFFKNKNKDKVSSKDKSSEKKKDKNSKEDKHGEEKDAVALRNKEEKSSSRTSLFRKSRSIERAKEKDSEGGPAKKRSKTLEPRRSGESGEDSSSRDASVRSSAATDEDSLDSPIIRVDTGEPKYPALKRESSSPDHQPTRQGTDEAFDGKGDAKTSVIYNSDSTQHSRSEDLSEGAVTSSQGKTNQSADAEMTKVNIAVSQQSKSFPATAVVVTAGLSKSERVEDRTNVKKSTTSAFSSPRKSDDSPPLLSMKPPLNPRMILPRGPLAASGFAPSSGVASFSQECDDYRFTPSPGIVTPPSSPGLSGQGISSYSVVMGSSSRPTSPDGRASMLSTPSSSTSSLSSITSRPISPSGRRTPPGPRMGTGGRLSSSPTAGRKSVRTNIKTNPVMGSRRGGSQSPISHSSSFTNISEIPSYDTDRLRTPPSSPVATRHDLKGSREYSLSSNDSNISSSKPSDLGSNKNTPTLPQVLRQGTPLSPSIKTKVIPPPPPATKVHFPAEPKLENVKQSSRSTSPTAGKSRHSISSLHSLESIPENDSDSQASANNTLEKNKSSSGISCKPLDPVTAMREHNKLDNGSAGLLLRHSAPEATTDRYMHVVPTHKRSSSLTPVTEERPLNENISKSVEQKEAIANSAHVVHDSDSNADNVSGKGLLLSSSTVENATNDVKKKIESVPNYNDYSKRRKTTNECPYPGNIGDNNKQLPNHLVTANKKISPFQGKEEDLVLGKISFPAGIVQENTETGKMVVDSTLDENVSDTSFCENSQRNSDYSHSDSGSSQMATHVVLQIPLRSSSFSNASELEKRVSVEILSGKEVKEVRRPEKGQRKRPRSVSTSRELKRDSSAEFLHRKRSLSNGPEEKQYFSTLTMDEEKEKLRQKICRRPSSPVPPPCRGSQSMPLSHLSERESEESQLDIESTDENQVVTVPWRHRTRSHSRMREGSVPDNASDESKGMNSVSDPSNNLRQRTRSQSRVRASPSSIDHTDPKPASSTGDIDSVNSRTRSRTRARPNQCLSTAQDSDKAVGVNNLISGPCEAKSQDKRTQPDGATAQRLGHSKSESENVCQVLNTSAQIHRPARHRSLSRDPERRMTRSFTSSDVKQDLNHLNDLSDTRDQARGRRAQSSSRVRETSVTSTDGEDQPVVRRPPRRRSLSTSRRKSSGIYEAPGKCPNIVVTGDKLAVDKSCVDSSLKDERIRVNDYSGNHQACDAKDRLVETSNFLMPNQNEVSPSEEGTDVKIEATVRIRRRSSTRERSLQPNDTGGGEGDEIVDIDIITQTEEQGLEKLTNEAQKKIDEKTDSVEEKKKELAIQEDRYQKQVDQLTLSLAEKQEEVRNLTQRLEELRSAKERLTDSEQLQGRLDKLQQELREKSLASDSLRVELQYSKNEAELTKSKLKKLEEELDSARQKNLTLQSQITANANCEKSDDLSTQISSLEDRLKISQAEKEKLKKTIEEIEAERDDEIKIIQDALEEAAQEREELIATFEKEFQNMNTMNSNREQQLMEDFEWKLREIEKEHKKKLEEKDRMTSERIDAMRNLVESELTDSITKVEEDRRVADDKLAEVMHLKSFEAEAIQLRGVTHELQKALRASAREMDRLKLRERILEEEVKGLKKVQPGSRQNTLHRHRRHADDTEDELRQKQEKLKNELNAEWEDKLRTECSRLKAELDDLHAEEKHLAVESMKVQKEQEIRALKQSWELRQEEMTKEISTLKDSLTDKDAYYHKEMENLRTNADRDVWELRRKLQKLDEKNWTQVERLTEKHTEEMERLKQDFKEQVADLDARLTVATRHSGEDDRRKLEKAHNDEVEHLCEQHRGSMERLREELEAEKFQAVEEARVIVSQHLEYINASLREQLLESTCANTQYREELEAIRAALTLREEVISSLEEELSKVKGGHEGSSTSSTYKASQYSIAGSEESNGSNTSQDRLSSSDSLDNQDDAQKTGGGSILGKVFGGGWFSSGKGAKDSGRRGSAPSTDKKSPSS